MDATATARSKKAGNALAALLLVLTLAHLSAATRSFVEMNAAMMETLRQEMAAITIVMLRSAILAKVSPLFAR